MYFVTQILPHVINVLILALVVYLVWRWRKVRHATLYRYQAGLYYERGKLVRVLGAGRHKVRVGFSEIEIIDLRPTIANLLSQDIMTRDRMGIKLSVSTTYAVSDPAKAHEEVTDYEVAFHDLAQRTLREVVSGLSVDELLDQRQETDAKLFGLLAERAEALGLKVSASGIKDIILPANLKRAYAGILEAQKDAQRQLEKARGEHAVLRSLANAARLYDGNPSLLQARLIQALGTGSHQMVFKSDGALGLAESGRSESSGTP